MSDWKDNGRNLEQCCKAYAHKTTEQDKVAKAAKEAEQAAMFQHAKTPFVKMDTSAAAQQEAQEYLDRMEAQHDAYMRHFEETGEW